MPENKNHVQFQRSLGLYSALSLVIGTIIGSGIFFKQSSILANAHTTTMAIAAWVIGGIITLTSGLTIAEIGSLFPHTGGLYVYIEKIYGKFWGFLAGWVQIIVYGPALIASLGAYLAILIGAFFHFPRTWTPAIAIISILLISLFNLLSNRFGAALQIFTTLCKMVPIFLIIICGILFGDEHALGQVVSNGQASIGNFGVAVLATLFAYDGWILIANLGGEIKNPQKILPLAIILGTSFVLIVYVLLTVGIFKAMPANQITKLGENAAPYFAIKMFGSIGGKILNLGIIISIIGTINGKIMTFPRIMFAMARANELPFSKQLAWLHPRMFSPVVSVLTMFSFASILILFFNPDRLSEICIFSIYCFYLIAFFGLFKLRKQRKDLVRPFKVPLYPLTPIIAILGAIFVMLSEIFSDLNGVLVSFVFILIGVPVYYWKVKK